MGDVAIRAGPTITIVISADKGKMSKIVKEVPIKHNKIPTANPSIKNVFSSLNENRVCCF